MSRHDEMPVLPEEATDLGTHVRACALRYNALLNRLVRVERIIIAAAVVLLVAEKGGPFLKLMGLL